MSAPRLPHHRRGPRIDERRYDPEEREIVRIGAAIGVGVFAMFVIALLARAA